jgi:hypothetical protein
MTGRIAAMTIDGTPVSDADIARLHAEEELHAEWRRKTARVIAASAHDVEDCRMLLDILGLGTDVVREARAECASTPPRRARRARRPAA